MDSNCGGLFAYDPNTKVAVATQMANLFEAPNNRFRIDTMGF